MKRKLFIRQVLFITLLVGLGAGCKKMDSSYDQFLKGGEKRFSKMPDSITILPGNERIGFQLMLSDVNIEACRIYWNFKSDSVDVQLGSSQRTKDTVTVIIDGLTEGRYAFSIFTIDRAGNFSIGSDTTAMVYGSKYQSGLANRGIISAEIVSGTPRISWLKIENSSALDVVLSYKTQTGERKIAIISNDEEVTELDERPLGDSLQLTTRYIPGPGAIDTFYSASRTIILQQAQPRELNKSNFASLELPGDATAYSGYSVSALWDDKYYDISDAYKAGDKDKKGLVFPLSVTIDLGTTAVLDHFVLWQMGADHKSYFYWNANVKKFELWGSMEPDADGGWESWTKLSEHEVVKPSGLGDNERDDNDIDQALAGHTFDLPDDLPAIRYVRVKVLETWKNYPGENRFFIQELSFYGIEE